MHPSTSLHAPEFQHAMHPSISLQKSSSPSTTLASSLATPSHPKTARAQPMDMSTGGTPVDVSVQETPLGSERQSPRLWQGLADITPEVETTRKNADGSVMTPREEYDDWVQRNRRTSRQTRTGLISRARDGTARSLSRRPNRLVPRS